MTEYSERLENIMVWYRLLTIVGYHGLLLERDVDGYNLSELDASERLTGEV